MSIYQEKICIIRQILFIQRHLQCVINPNERLAANALIWKVPVVAAALDLFAVASGVFRLGTPNLWFRDQCRSLGHLVPGHSGKKNVLQISFQK